MAESYRIRHLNAAGGCLLILVGLTLNNHTISSIFDLDALGPRSLVLVWAFDLASISWGVVAITYGAKPAVTNMNVMLLSMVLSLTASEVTLRLWPRLLGQAFANGVLSKYHADRGGIYYRDPGQSFNLMIPNLRTQMYYNGYVWSHETDAFGFRNRDVRTPSDMILLGDSLIYGHGVEWHETVGYFLEQLTRLTVTNLARQGDCAWQEAHLLTRYIKVFRPRYVLYFFFENDISDLHHYLTNRQLMTFIEQSIDRKAYEAPVDTEAALNAHAERLESQKRVGSLYSQLRHRLYMLRVMDWIRYIDRESARNLARRQEAHDVNNPMALGWRYTRKAMRYMRDVTGEHGARFVIVPITPDKPGHYDILKQIAEEDGMELIDTSEIRRSNRALFLANDVHFNGTGARVMAEIVAGYLQSRT